MLKSYSRIFQMVSLCTFLGAGFSSTALAQVVAQVGNSKITLKEFKTEYGLVKKQALQVPKPEVFLEDLIRLEIGFQEAEKKKMRKDPRIEKQIKQVLYRGLLEQSLSKKVDQIKVTEREMRRFYKNNPEIRTSHILIQVKLGATAKQVAEAKKRAQQIYSDVKKSKRPFEELVKLYSDDTLSKSTGGDIGYQTRVTLVPAYYQAAQKLKVGKVTGVVRSRYGFHILKLTGRRAYSQANKTQIRASVFEQKRAAIFNKYFSSVSKKYKIRRNTKLIRNL